MKPTRKPSVSLVSETAKDVLMMPSLLISGGPLVKSAVFGLSWWRWWTGVRVGF